MMPSCTARLGVALLAVSVGFVAIAKAHGGSDDDLPPAELAGQKPHKPGYESYIQRHMANEHHIGAFDLASFFTLHDLNLDGVLDRAEIEAIYGVHHSMSVKHSPSYEVHDEKANKIVSEVLFRLDKDNDGLVTKAEFVNAGPDGLPHFAEYGKDALGHHYDEESEYFVHHEERYHNTPDTQKPEAYNHPEDIEHFKHHKDIEAEEERRERTAEGMISAEEDARRKQEAEARGETYQSVYEAQIPKEDSPVAPQHAFDAHGQGSYALNEAVRASQYTFKTPEGEHTVHSGAVDLNDSPGVQAAGKPAGGAAAADAVAPLRQQGETDEGYKDRLAAFEAAKQAQASYDRVNPNLAVNSYGIDPKTGDVVRLPGETDEDFLQRKARFRYSNTKTQPEYEPAKQEQLRKSAPYKYPPIQNRLKKSSFYGEF